MGVTREAALWAYRILLEREAESDEVVQRLCDMPDMRVLRQSFLNSEEYRSRNPSTPVIGRYFDTRTVPVQVTADDAEIQAMVDRIAREWRKFGETEPHWSVLVDERFTAGNIDAHIDRFYETGFNDLRFIMNPLARSGIATDHFGKVLDFGCGVGRLSLALSSCAESVLGIDISPPHVRLAEDRAAATDVRNATFRAIDSPDDLDGVSGFDLIVSLIVLQHNPPPVMAVILAKLFKALAPGGVAVIQLPTYIDGYTFTVPDYLANAQPAMEMNALPQPAIFAMADEADCRILEVREDHWIGQDPGISQTFAFQRKG